MNPSQAIRHLLAAGLTETEIGRKVSARQSTINRIKHGAMVPSWEIGNALVRLAEETPLDEGEGKKAA